MSWWRGLWGKGAEPAREEPAPVWRCNTCGKEEDRFLHLRSEHHPETCSWCFDTKQRLAAARRARIAELAALVAGKNPQATYRGADARMTADAAWAIAEEIYRKERGR